MFSPLGCRRGFPRERKSRWDGPPPPPYTYGPQEAWDKPPWKLMQRRGRGRGHLPCPQDPRLCPGVPWNEEDEGWGPHDGPPPHFWDSCEGSPGPEDFTEDCYPEPGPDCFSWSELPNEEQHPPWPPPLQARERGGFRGAYREPRGRWRWCPRRGHQGLPRGHVPRPRPSRGRQPSFAKPVLLHKSQVGVKEDPQQPGPPQTPTPSKDGAQSREQAAQSPPEGSGKASEPPQAASTPRKSSATDPQAVTEAAEPEQAEGAMLVKPGARQKPAGSHNQDLSALETEAAPPESSAGPGQPLQLLSGLQLSENLQVPPGATLEPDAEPSQACSNVCTTPGTSPWTQHPPGSSETKPAQARAAPQCSPQGIPRCQHRAAGSQPQLSSKPPTASPASADLRSAAVLARKQELELSYQQFSLAIAVVATMLLQKEPSMEAPLGLALRANLRQGRIHHLRELENFISSYDSASLGHQSEGTNTPSSPATAWGMAEDRAGGAGGL